MTTKPGELVRSISLDATHPAFTVEEPPEDYARLLAAARQLAVRIVETSPRGLTGAPGYMRRASEERCGKK